MSHAFWEWSLERYDQRGVQSICLDLQDQYGLNVNICLWCCWLAEEGRDALPSVYNAVDALEPWSSDITQAIRETRRKLKDWPDAATLYKSVLACELDAEHTEQDILFELSVDAPSSDKNPAETALQSLEEYARLKRVHIDFTSLVKVVFPTAKKV